MSAPLPPYHPAPPTSLSGAVEVQVPEDPVVALVGTDATLRCSFLPEPDFSLAQLNLIWQLTDTKQLVHSFAKGRDQGSAYANRTALFTDLLAQGNASLRLQRVRVADEGSFTCFVSIRDFGSAAVSLQVAGERREGAPALGALLTLLSAPDPLPCHCPQNPSPSADPSSSTCLFLQCVPLSLPFLDLCPLPSASLQPRTRSPA